MSDTDTLHHSETGINPDLPSLPPRRTNQSPKQIFEPNKLNLFPYEEDGKTYEGFVRFSKARLIGVTAREQEDNKGKPHLVVTMNILLNEPEVGIVNDDDTVEMHALVSDSRYDEWQDPNLPKRVNAQQWVQATNTKLVLELVNFLYHKYGWSIQRDLKKRPNSQRKTTDLFVARPSNGRGMSNEERNERYGVPLTSFEVSVNPNYEPGFKNFLEGVESIRSRWEGLRHIEDEALLAEALEIFSQHFHFIGGIYYDNEQKRWWARPVDVGAVEVEDPEGGSQPITFPMYEQRGEELTEDVFADLVQRAEHFEESSEEEGKQTGSPLKLDDVDPKALAKVRAARAVTSQGTDDTPEDEQAF